jgi:hypothetical protein
MLQTGFASVHGVVSWRHIEKNQAGVGLVPEKGSHEADSVERIQVVSNREQEVLFHSRFLPGNVWWQHQGKPRR